MSRPAVFLDRDGTLIEHVDYLSAPQQVRLLPGVALSLRRLREAGYACVVVTNQAAIAKGLLTEDGLVRVHEEMARQLTEQGAAVDAIYHCPLASRSGDQVTVDFADRKPGPGMLLRASAELGLDLGRSWLIGDAVSDVLAGRNAGCGGLVLLGDDRERAELAGVSYQLCRTLSAAVAVILGRDQAT